MAHLINFKSRLKSITYILEKDKSQLVPRDNNNLTAKYNSRTLDLLIHWEKPFQGAFQGRLHPMAGCYVWGSKAFPSLQKSKSEQELGILSLPKLR